MSDTTPTRPRRRPAAGRSTPPATPDAAGAAGAPAAAPGRFVRRQIDAAAALRISTRHLRHLVSAMGAPGPTADGWDIVALRTWRSANVLPAQGGHGDRMSASTSGSASASGAGESGDGPPTDRQRLQKAQADLAEARASLAELRLKIESGAFMPLEAVKQHDIARCHAVRDGLRHLPRRLCHDLAGRPPREIQAILEHELREVCRKLSEM